MTRAHLPQAQANPQADDLLHQLSTIEQELARVREALHHSHRLATLGTIASIIAHEYNNILTPVISYAQLALANPEDAELARKSLAKTLAGAERAASISASLLGFARETDERDLARVPQTVDEAMSCIAREPKKDGITLELKVEEATVRIPSLDLQQVLINLVLNARKAMRRRGGSLHIRGRVTGDQYELSVADTGPGIPPQIKSRLFEPFVTQPTTQDEVGQPKGTGLGLCICRDLIRAAGGSISVASELGQGATFCITLPLAEPLV